MFGIMVCRGFGGFWETSFSYLERLDGIVLVFISHSPDLTGD